LWTHADEILQHPAAARDHVLIDIRPVRTVHRTAASTHSRFCERRRPPGQHPGHVVLAADIRVVRHGNGVCVQARGGRELAAELVAGRRRAGGGPGSCSPTNASTGQRIAATPDASRRARTVARLTTPAALWR
jgi:hypothetical protein